MKPMKKKRYMTKKKKRRVRRRVTVGSILEQLQAIVDEHGPDAEVAVSTYADPGRLWMFNTIGSVYHTNKVVQVEDGFCDVYEDEETAEEMESGCEMEAVDRPIVVFTTGM